MEAYFLLLTLYSVIAKTGCCVLIGFVIAGQPSLFLSLATFFKLMLITCEHWILNGSRGNEGMSIFRKNVRLDFVYTQAV